MSRIVAYRTADGRFHDPAEIQFVTDAAGDPHEYLSTACLHGKHAYCQSSTGVVGSKVPAQCKFCAAPCLCACHRAGGGVGTETVAVPRKAFELLLRLASYAEAGGQSTPDAQQAVAALRDAGLLNAGGRKGTGRTAGGGQR